MLNFFLYLLISIINVTYSYPFNSTLCVECITKINYIQNNNNTINTINTIEQNINNMCDYYNISGCNEKTKNGKQWLLEPPETICRDLDYCDRLSYDNMILSTDNGYGIGWKLYRYYDLIVSLKEDILLDRHIVNHTKIWSLKIDEPFKSVSVIDIHNTTIWAGGGSLNAYSCLYECPAATGPPPNIYPYAGTYILKLTTTNLLYYINITTGTILSKYTINNIKYNVALYNVALYLPPYNNTWYDTTYNGTAYTNIINANFEQSTCNKTTGNVKCLNFVGADFTSVQTAWESQFPTEKPRCGEALELYCPHNFKNREDCLNCVIKNRDIFSVCSIEDEENWCRRNN